MSEWRRTHDFGSSQRQAFMTEAADFFCPQCTSRYKLVRVRAEPPHATRTIHCKVCKESLPPTDGDYALKYFLVDKAKKHNGVDLRMKHSRRADGGSAATPSPAQGWEAIGARPVRQVDDLAVLSLRRPTRSADECRSSHHAAALCAFDTAGAQYFQADYP